MTAPSTESARTQCRGYRVGEPCRSEPRFRVSYGPLVEWACGHHMTSSVLWLSERAAGASAVHVEVYW